MFALSEVLATGLLVATLLCIAANTVEVAAKAVGARFVLRNCAEVGIGREWIRYLAVIEAAGVAGLVLGLLGPRLIGLAAAAGLVSYFVAAVATHIRARVFHNIAYPVAFLCLAVAALWHFARSAG